MPDVTPNSPDEFAAFDSEFAHVRAHRALERGIEALGTGTPGTSSTAAPVKGIYRTAAPVAVAVPAILMLGVTTVTVVQTFSVETQMGNAIQVGDPVIVVPTTALPTNVQLGGARCSDTNTIVVSFLGSVAATVTATFTTHIFTFDIT